MPAPRVKEPQHIYRRRRATLLAAIALPVLAAGALLGSGDDSAPERTSADEAALPPAPRGLPRGGNSILPEFRVVAYYGAPQSRALGALGIGSPRGATRRLLRQARPYATERRPVLPALELITVIANRDAGRDGMYRTRQTDAVIRRYLRAARRARALLLLDIQPGRSDFFTEATRLRKWLREPDVGLALDPEWHVQAGQMPGRVIGSVGAREVNATSAWLSQLVAKHKLPEKLFLVHQFTPGMVPVPSLKKRDGLAMVINVDGFGGREVKIAKYRSFAHTAKAAGFRRGIKLFYEEDTKLMKPRQVLRMPPPPDVVVYE
jgi:hypothetical protein